MECKYCNGLIKDDAVKCKHCGEWLDPEHFLSIVNTTASFQSIQNALITHVSAIVDSKIKMGILIAIFLLGGSGVVVVKTVLSTQIEETRKQMRTDLQEAWKTTERAKIIFEDAENSIKIIERAQQTLSELEKSKDKLSNALSTLKERKGIEENTFADLVDDILVMKTDISKLKRLNSEILTPQLNQRATQQFNKELAASKNQAQSLKNRMKYSKYLIRVGSYSNSTLPTTDIIQALMEKDLTAVYYQFKKDPLAGEEHTSIVIGRDIPNDVLKLLLIELIPYKSYFSYIRYNHTSYQNENIFIGSNSKRSIDAGHQKLLNTFWDKIKDGNAKAIINELVNIDNDELNENLAKK